MIRRLHWMWIAPVFLAALALSSGAAGAADRTKVDQATKRVERGAKQVGQLVGQRAKEANIEAVVFDRGGFKFHGRVAAVAEGAREAGLTF